MNTDVPGDASKLFTLSFNVELKSFNEQMSSHMPHIKGNIHISMTTSSATLMTI